MIMLKCLVTGGAGYIGSHTVLSLLEAGYEVTVLDNFSNSSAESISRIEEIVGKSVNLINGDIRDSALLDSIFQSNKIDAVLHFAGLKSVSESVEKPLMYYDNNVAGTITLCEAMLRANIFKFVFSSSATVYGEPEKMPVHEGMPTGVPTNAYGRSKLMVEQVLSDLIRSDSRWKIAILRYFNPVGAHHSGKIGENPSGIPNNLLPYISQVAVGKLKELSVFGDDYDTVDGTGVRDYIHVMDLAAGHLSALKFLSNAIGLHTWNLGTGVGYSVLEMIKAFEKASGKAVPYKVVPRRAGDIAECWADVSKSKKELGWVATRHLNEMMEDAWRWQHMNPSGY